MIDSTNDPDAPIPCPTCNRPILLDELRCRSCGTMLEEYSVDAEELDFSGDGDEWEDESTPDRGFLIVMRVLGGIAALGIIAMFCGMATRPQSVGDGIGLAVLALLFGVAIWRMLFYEARG